MARIVLSFPSLSIVKVEESFSCNEMTNGWSLRGPHILALDSLYLTQNRGTGVAQLPRHCFILLNNEDGHPYIYVATYTS
jgi:hypothetical protein